MVRKLTRSMEELRAESRSTAAFQCAVVEMQGGRPTHEDAHSMSCNDRWGDFWVLDGHRGVEAATFCAAALGDEIGDSIEKGRLPSDKSIRQGFRTIDSQLRKHLKNQANQKGKDSKSGTTVVGALAARADDGLYTVKLINCGDARALIIKGPQEDHDDRADDGPATILETRDHKPDTPAEKARIKAAGGVVSGGSCPRIDGRLAVSRGLGDFEFKANKALKANKQKVSCEPDVYEINGLEPGTIVLLACDGVWNVLTSEAVASMVRKALTIDPLASMEEIAASIARVSLERGSTDNLTVLLAHLAANPPAPAANTEKVMAGGAGGTTSPGGVLPGLGVNPCVACVS